MKKQNGLPCIIIKTIYIYVTSTSIASIVCVAASQRQERDILNVICLSKSCTLITSDS